MMLASVLKGIVVWSSLLPGAQSAEPIVALDRTEADLVAAAATTTGGDQFAGSIRPEVRLRKLHLVRPDLIPYPIAHEVYC
jgi:hypothetical protein